MDQLEKLVGQGDRDSIIRKFQKDMDLVSDGIVGKITRKWLDLIPSSDLLNAINNTLKEFKITNPALFLAQLSHESGNFTRFVENLNYSAKGLQTTWPTRFNSSNANIYARQPEKIANKVYANRMGNGDEASGDGWRYRGRGAIQLTGKYNYTLYGYLNNPDVLLTLPESIRSAGKFWEYNKLEGKSLNESTRIINGGYNGLEDRKERYAMYQKLIDKNYITFS